MYIIVIMSNYNTKNKENNSKLRDNVNYENGQNKKIPLKSMYGRRCLTKCHPKGEIYLHPVLLTAIWEENNSCAIEPVHSKDAAYVKINEMIWADTCRIEDNNLFQIPNELESILSSFYFSPRDFLSSVYDIYSFDDAIYWTIENDYLPFDTIKRVHNCAWKVYGSKIEELSNNVIEYYYNISRTYWLKDYAHVIQNDYSFDFVSQYKTPDITDSYIAIYDILYSKFYTYDFFSSALKRYVYEFENKWDLVESHYGQIKKYIFSQLVDNIENNLSSKRTSNNNKFSTNNI